MILVQNSFQIIKYECIKIQDNSYTPLGWPLYTQLAFPIIKWVY